MDHQQAERLCQSAEDSHRASLEAWGKAFDNARGSGGAGDWDLEESTWRASRQAGLVRSLSWEVAEEVLTDSRERVRRSFIDRFEPAAPPNGSPRPLAARLGAEQEEVRPV
ncbi:MAG: hypothetical protein ACREPA_07345 [Candidatus Dormibacteraceae bacterium]